MKFIWVQFGTASVVNFGGLTSCLGFVIIFITNSDYFVCAPHNNLYAPFISNKPHVHLDFYSPISYEEDTDYRAVLAYTRSSVLMTMTLQ